MKSNNAICRTVMSLLAFSSIAPGIASALPTSNNVRWDFASPREVTDSSGIEGSAFKDGVYSGKTAHAPFFLLRLPEAGIDANTYNVLRVRLYSSAPADALAVFYKSTGGDWAIGAGPAITAGWQTLEIDLRTQIAWERAEGNRPEARVWGGPDKNVAILRLDPGNEAGRDLQIDWVELAAGGPVAASKNAVPQQAVMPPASAVTGPTSWTWHKEGELLGWASGNFQNIKATDGVLRGLTDYDPALVSPPLNFAAKDFGIFEFRIKSDVSGSGELFFSRTGENISEGRMLYHSIVGDGKFHTYRVYLDRDPNWTGSIEQLRFDPLNAKGANIEIAFVRLLPSDTGNIIGNGGFEQTTGEDAGTLPEKWTFKSAPGAKTVGISLDSQGASQGRYSLRLTGIDKDRVTLSPSNFELTKTGQQQLSFDYRVTTAAKAILNIKFLSVYGAPLQESFRQSIPLRSAPKWQSIQLPLDVPARAYEAALSLEIVGGKTVQLDNVAIRPVELKDTVAVDSGEPSWSAFWIAPKDRAGKDTDARNFRKAFNLDDPSQVESARVIVTADNVARLFVNGRELPASPTYADWTKPDVYDIARYLVKGRNVIGIQSFNQGSLEAMIAEVGVHLKNGSTIYLKTDDTWLAKTGALPADWSAPTFNDKSWLQVELIAKVPGTPWGPLPYTYLGPTMQFSDAKFTFASGGILGETKQFSLSFVPKVIPRQPVSVSLALSRAGERDIVFHKQTLDTKNWKPGQRVQIGPLPVHLPKYAVTGSYKVRVRVPYSSLQAASPETGGVKSIIADSLEQEFDLKVGGAVKNPVAKVVYLQNGQVPALSINGQVRPVLHYMGANADPTIVKNAAENGINLNWLNVPLHVPSFVWKKNGPYDFSELERQVCDLLNQQPDAYIVLNLTVDSVYNPGMRDWNAQNRDELVKDQQGNTNIGAYAGAINEAPHIRHRCG